jgi:signal transduction histidine kinase
MLSEVIDSMNEGMIEVRRALRDLRSTPLDDLGLRLALENLAVTAAARASLRLELHLPTAFDGLSAEQEQGIYRVIQEALENVVRHADANAVTVHAQAASAECRFSIQDDGRGFDVNKAHSSSHFGLNGMVQRVHLMRGDLQIVSTPGNGTRVEFSVRRV